MHAQFKILEEDIDENYEPTREEILEYASYLGMSPRSDSKYFHIAREGLKTPLPQPWKPVELRNGEIFYFNPLTQVLQEQHPLDDHFKRKYVEEKKKDAQFNQPSKTSKKLKGLCEQLRDPTSEEPIQKTEKKQPYPADVSTNNLSDVSQLNESTYFKEQSDLADNQFKFELLQYEKEQESFVQLYKINRAKQLEQDKSGQQDSSFEDTNRSDIPEKAIQVRQDFLNKKEELKQNQQELFESKIICEKEQLLKKSIEKIKEYKNEKEKKNISNLEQFQKEMDNKIANKKQMNSQLEKDLQQKKTQSQIVYKQKEKQLEIKWQNVQKKYQQEVEKEFAQILFQLEQDLELKKNEILDFHRLEKIKLASILNDFYSRNSEYQVKQRWREIYKEKTLLSKISATQEMENELKSEEIQFFEQMTGDVIKYKNLIRQNFIRMKQQQIDNDRLYYNNFYKEQIQNFKSDHSKKIELQIQRLELNQIIMANESFTQLDKSQFKIQLNPDLRIQKKELELQIQEYHSRIDGQKKQLIELKGMKEETQFVIQVMNQSDRVDFLQQSLNEKDQILNDLTKQLIQQPYIVEDNSFSPNTTKNFKHDQWGAQIDQEQQWLTLQKERLKYDKKQLKKHYEKLTLLSSNNEQIDSYNKCVNTVRNNQQIVKNCEYIVNKLYTNLKQYNQTKIIHYLKENDTLLEDLSAQKVLLESVQQLPIESNLLYKSYRVGSASLHQNELNASQLQQFTNNQKQSLRDMKDYLNKSMQSRLS